MAPATLSPSSPKLISCIHHIEPPEEVIVTEEVRVDG
ncbi:hypothetical protein A2U01_0050248 [Trifolium medium]|uniref:Uncharacterized protein n=1 Tax=Trifolium medium TaxID=97028 RepID=A0A392QYS6_9FABA|nr:hypothetical protein [Trifolium medium]